MEIGQLNRRVTLINCVRVEDGAGGFTRADANEVTVWASAKPASWNQQQQALKLEQRISLVLRIRWRADLAHVFGPEARATLIDAGGHSRSLSVKTVVDPDERRNWLELGCSEGGPL